MLLKDLTTRVVALLTTALVALTVFQAPAAVAVPGPADTIENLQTSYVLEIAPGSSGQRVDVTLWHDPNNTASNLKWTYDPETRLIKNVATGYVIEHAPGDTGGNRAPAYLWHDNTNTFAQNLKWDSAAFPATEGMCLDIGDTRDFDDNARIYDCLDHTNQRFVIVDGQIKVEDTIGTGSEMCLSVAGGRTNGQNVRIRGCAASNNQQWVTREGQIVVKDTIGTGSEMCLDAGGTRNNGDNVFIYTCGNLNTNQQWVVQRGYVKLKDTLS
ncbi:RICIN domain-containing protein [Streptomyces cavernicola]|uniref:Ricin-type beta-trefoil lectin domain protein n=1 Tax=Streptomyces cavernicola TaxID=3043613 RepID=A0ABT6SLS5_9ACTN|nr:RICIN domain-containing protein [Streptomyces sp. B-S-A6]MDI3409034.1 ricin-type beta-trefoil lectin domain protein [Streptomyces sp. B-S-A6]